MLTPPWAVITDGAIDNVYAESSSRVTSKQTVQVVRYLRRASCAQNLFSAGEYQFTTEFELVIPSLYFSIQMQRANTI